MRHNTSIALCRFFTAVLQGLECNRIIYIQNVFTVSKLCTGGILKTVVFMLATKILKPALLYMQPSPQ